MPLSLHHRTNERRTESHGERQSERPKHRRRTAHTGLASPAPGGRGTEKDRRRQSRKRSFFEFSGQIFLFLSVRFFENRKSNFSRSNFCKIHGQIFCFSYRRAIPLLLNNALNVSLFDFFRGCLFAERVVRRDNNLLLVGIAEMILSDEYATYGVYFSVQHIIFPQFLEDISSFFYKVEVC